MFSYLKAPSRVREGGMGWVLIAEMPTFSASSVNIYKAANLLDTANRYLL